jgi:methyl coenzyme M reductase subunit C-like uncharacterized protein (methanogenesis marker protein 7)
MERNAALKIIQKLMGNPKGFGYRVDSKALDAEHRAAAKVELEILTAIQKDATDRMEERKRHLLQDPTYVELVEKAKAVRKHVDEVRGEVYARKITVGISNSLWFSVKADGDSWEEIIKKLSADKVKA